MYLAPRVREREATFDELLFHLFPDRSVRIGDSSVNARHADLRFGPVEYRCRELEACLFCICIGSVPQDLNQALGRGQYASEEDSASRSQRESRRTHIPSEFEIVQDALASLCIAALLDVPSHGQ